MKSVFLVLTLIISSVASARLDYKPYSYVSTDGKSKKSFYTTEAEMEMSLQKRKDFLLSKLGVKSITSTGLALSNLELENGLVELLANSYVGNVLLITVLKDSEQVIEVRIRDKRSVALDGLRGETVRKTLQSSYCALLSPFAFFRDVFCLKTREEARNSIENLENKEIYLDEVMGTEVVRIAENKKTGERLFEVYKYSLWKEKYVFSKAISIEKMMSRLQKVYTYHSLLRANGKADARIINSYKLK